MPEITAVITEHQGHARTCPSCGTVTRAVIPADIRAHGVGPRLAGVMAYTPVFLRGPLGQRVFHLPRGFGVRSSGNSFALLDAGG